jgi:hypothetical protein
MYCQYNTGWNDVNLTRDSSDDNLKLLASVREELNLRFISSTPYLEYSIW